MKKTTQICFLVLSLWASLCSAEDNIPFSVTQQEEMEKLIEDNIPAETFIVMDDYAGKLMDSYPPESHTLLVLGSQNLILTAALYNKLGKDAFSQYVQVAPLSGLSEYMLDITEDIANTFFSRIIPDRDRLDNRKLVIVRVLQSGYNMIQISGRLENYLSMKKIRHHFDFYFSDSETDIEDYFRLLEDYVTIRCDKNNSWFCNYNENLRKTFKYSFYKPLFLYDHLSEFYPDFFKTWTGWEINPDFKYLADLYRKKVGHLKKTSRRLFSFPSRKSSCSFFKDGAKWKTV